MQYSEFNLVKFNLDYNDSYSALFNSSFKKFTSSAKLNFVVKK